MEQQSRAGGMEIYQDKSLGEGDYIIIERQSLHYAHTLALCCAAELNAWDRIEEVRKKFESLVKVIEGPKETFTDFL